MTEHHEPRGIDDVLPKIFVGSASEAEPVARSVGDALKPAADIHHWREVFALGEYNLQALQREAAECDFAVFVWGVEDHTVSRGGRAPSPRDNAVYEAGLFAGALGEDRVFVLHASNTKIPSDLLGVTTATFEVDAPALDKPIARLRSRMISLGPKPVSKICGHWWQIVETEDKNSVLSFFEIRSTESGRSVRMHGRGWTDEGKHQARWFSTAAEIDEQELILRYSWEGEHPKVEGQPQFFGVGEIRFGHKPTKGRFSSTDRSPQGLKKPTILKSAFYFRAQRDDVRIMEGGSNVAARKKLILEKLDQRAAFE